MRVQMIVVFAEAASDEVTRTTADCSELGWFLPVVVKVGDIKLV